MHAAKISELYGKKEKVPSLRKTVSSEKHVSDKSVAISLVDWFLIMERRDSLNDIFYSFVNKYIFCVSTIIYLKKKNF